MRPALSCGHRDGKEGDSQRVHWASYLEDNCYSMNLVLRAVEHTKGKKSQALSIENLHSGHKTDKDDFVSKFWSKLARVILEWLSMALNTLISLLSLSVYIFNLCFSLHMTSFS